MPYPNQLILFLDQFTFFYIIHSL